MLSGSPILMGDNTIPGVKIHKEVREQVDLIFSTCREFGLDFYPTIIEFLTYDEISEIASYGGFPVRYPHWRFGMEYEQMSKGYEYNQFRISEMVINSNPCIIYCLDSNTLVDNVDVIAHALGHNDFFKNNVFFSHTNTNMVNKMANHSTRIRKYMSRWGKEKVTEFIDNVLRIETLIDPSHGWKTKKIKKYVVQDERKYHQINRKKAEHNYMDDWINGADYLKTEHERTEKEDVADQLELFEGPEKDIFGYIKDHAPLKAWQQDIISMLYEEAMYFSPQRATKTINEGWASLTDYYIMCKYGLVSAGQPKHDAGIIEYSIHKMHVLGGKYSMNPYKLGFELLLDIEDRWNKGRFGKDYDECQNMREKAEWDTKLGLGKEKIFEVRKFYNDGTLINEFFTPEFCEKNEFFEWKRYPNGEYKIVDRNFKSIKKKLLQRHLNGGLPDIRLTDPNHLGKGYLFLQHMWDSRPLYDDYVRETITSLWKLWQNVCILATTDTKGREFVYLCDGPRPEKVHTMLRTEYEKEYVR
jgi:stage V sporulation protein R